MRRERLDLLAYLVSSAANLKQEPAAYGPLRLVDAEDRTIDLFREQGIMSDPGLDAIAEDIREHLFSVMDEPEEFDAMLRRANVELAKIVKES